MCRAKTKTKVAAGRQEGLLVARNQSGRHPGSQAGAKNMLMSIILCVICFHASQAACLLPPSPSLYLLCHYVPEYSYSYSHSHIYSHNVCANNFVSYFKRHGNHSTTYLISFSSGISSHFPAPKFCVSLQVSVVPLQSLLPSPLS